MVYARIQDGIAVEIIRLPEGLAINDAFHPDIAATFVAATGDVGQGWLYDGNTFTAPAESEPAPPPARRQFTFLEFMDLFTEAEQLTLVEASMTFPAIKLWYDKAVGAQYIDLDDPRTGDGLQKLVDENLITAERKASVMAGQSQI
jgi:hypothetical protein